MDCPRMRRRAKVRLYPIARHFSRRGHLRAAAARPICKAMDTSMIVAHRRARLLPCLILATLVSADLPAATPATPAPPAAPATPATPATPACFVVLLVVFFLLVCVVWLVAA